MGGRISWAAAAIGIVSGFWATLAQADELAMNNVSAELAAMSARLETMEAQLHSVMSSGSDVTGDCSCGAKNCGPTSCCDCGWYVGAGAYFLVPNWKTNPAFATSTNGGVTEASQTDFDYDLSFAPLVWIGYRGPSCFGFEARAWWYDDSETINLTNDGVTAIGSASPLGLENLSTTAGDELTFNSSLEIDVVDIIGTYTRQFGIATVDLGTGIRYARVEQQYHHTETPANAEVDAIDSIHSMEGAGPTFALRGRAALTDRVTLLADFRYSLLFGDFRQRAVSTVNNAVSQVRTYASDDFLGITEIELGGEYLIPSDRVDFFVDGAFVVQYWQSAGNSANNDIIIVSVDTEASDKNCDMAMIGFRLGGGVRF
jgi:hypothetical protein